MISVCMIVWNEVGVVEDAIASTRGLADEIIVVDTGSTDGTPDVLRDFGCTVITGGDRMNKAAARNLSLDHATGDWIIVLDADERFEDPEGIRNYIMSERPIYFALRIMRFIGGRPVDAISSPRGWRRPLMKYKYRAHEIPMPALAAAPPPIENTNFVIRHDNVPGRAWKGEYTLNRLMMDREEHPRSSRVLFLLGYQHYSMGNYDEAIEILNEYVEGKHPVFAGDAYMYMALSYVGLDMMDDYVDCLTEACGADPYRRDWFCKLAAWYCYNEEYVSAKKYIDRALDIPPHESRYYVMRYHDESWDHLAAFCDHKLGVPS